MFAAVRLRWTTACLGVLLLDPRGHAANPPDPRYTGALSVQEWTPEETGGKHQSFSIIQQPASGLIYVGNEAGVLEFDGVRWRRLPLPTGAPLEGVVVRGLEFDDQGRLWAGTDNDVLIYSPNERGQWRPESLQSHLPANESELGVVWELSQQQAYVWGVTTLGIIRIDRHSLLVRRWPVKGNPALIGRVDGDIWFRHEGNQLLRVHDGELEKAPIPALPERLWVLGVTRTAGGVLQIEHAGGVLEQRGDGWVPWSVELGAALGGTDSASRVCRLPDGGRIFNTRSRSLVLVNPVGRVLGRIQEPAGVNFGVTPRTFLDRDGGFWMANASGVRRVQIDRVIVRHGAAQGLRGGARKLMFDGETLLVASAQGLFVRDAATGTFAYQAGSPQDQQALLPSPAGGWLMAAGQRFAEWRNGVSVQAPGAPENGLSLAADPRADGRVLVGAFNEIAIYRRRPDAWQKEATLKGVAASLYYAAGDSTGTVWFSDGSRPGVWRATASGGDWTKATVDRMDGRSDDPAPRIPGGLWKVATVHGEVLVYGANGIWCEDKPGGRLVPDTRFAGLPKGAATPLGCVAGGVRRDTVYVAGAQGWRARCWRGTREREDEPWKFSELPLTEGRTLLQLQDMQESPDGRTLWLGGFGEAYSVDLGAQAQEFRVPETRWRGVRTLEDNELVFGGAGASGAMTLPQGRRAVALEFAAPSLRTHLGGRTGIEYRTFASGVDRDWTAWSAVASRELTNLPPGAVQLRVQARNHLGVEGPVAAMALLVPSFWWETWWAKSLALLAGAAGVAVIVRILVRRQFRQRIALLEAQAAVQQERLRIARDMHDDLGSTLASIAHLSDRGVPAPRPAEEALGRIHEATRDLVQRTRDIVWAATPQHDTLESLIEQMAGHMERTLGDRGVVVKIELPVQVPEEAVGSAARHDLFMAFKEAVNNAAKYAQSRTATLRVELSTTELIVTLADDGVGFAPGEVKGTGHGLGNLRQRLAALGGGAEITSTKGRGTTAVLRLPRATGPGT